MLEDKNLATGPERHFSPIPAKKAVASTLICTYPLPEYTILHSKGTHLSQFVSRDCSTTKNVSPATTPLVAESQKVSSADKQFGQIEQAPIDKRWRYPSVALRPCPISAVGYLTIVRLPRCPWDMVSYILTACNLPSVSISTSSFSMSSCPSAGETISDLATDKAIVATVESKRACLANSSACLLAHRKLCVQEPLYELDYVSSNQIL